MAKYQTAPASAQTELKGAQAMELVTNPLPWVLIFFSTMIGANGVERVSLAPNPTFQQTQASCLAEGNRKLSTIDIGPGFRPQFVCVPAAAFGPPLRPAQ